MRAFRRFTVRPVLPEALGALSVLAGNLRWSWHPPTQDVFASVDATLWREVNADPVRLLGAVGRERLDELVDDADFCARLDAAHTDLQHYLSEDRWYARKADSFVSGATSSVSGGDTGGGAPSSVSGGDTGGGAPRAIAYFSPEYGISTVLPQYSGGLGILAGDHLKASSDLGIPLIGVGLFYRHGYFKQALNRDGWQQESYPVLDPDELPLTQLREPDGTRATVSIALPDGPDLVARILVAQVGRVPLLLLDSDIEENSTHYRDVTDRLYGGNSEHRLRQELLLGVGGVRALRVWSRITGDPAPEVFHTNEGHAGFLGIERIRELTVAEDGPRLDFDTALEVSRAGTVFTTHTPVPAGIDRFPRELVSQYFGGGSSPTPGVPVDRVLALGAEDYDSGDAGVFNMAVMGFRLAQRANGVSELHGHVSRGMFNGLWPAFDEAEVPITSITNGVHGPSWIAREVIELAASRGGDIDGDDTDALWPLVDQISDRDIWDLKRTLRTRFVEDARVRMRRSASKRGFAPAETTWIDSALDPDVLTIGFARRVPTYKRLTLMLRDPARLKKLLLDPERPIQLVIAGKAHPADETGKRLIQEMVRFADDPEIRHRIAFLPNYDIAMAQPLYPGCDVWLNNPLRPYEACGTSGMKAALNGGLNLSILDGWWDEWYDGNNGWAIPSADGIDDPDRRDDLEANALYDLLETEVVPRFYETNDEGVPPRWLEMVRHTLKSLGPKVLATRQVRDYVRQLYVPAAQTARSLNSDYAGAHTLATWKQSVRAAWPGVRVEHIESEGVGDQAEVGATLAVRAWVALGDLSASDVVVQVIHGRIGADDLLTSTTASPMQVGESYEGNRHRFDAAVRLEHSGAFGYTVRVVPRNDALASVAELGLVAEPA